MTSWIKMVLEQQVRVEVTDGSVIDGVEASVVVFRNEKIIIKLRPVIETFPGINGSLRQKIVFKEDKIE